MVELFQNIDQLETGGLYIYGAGMVARNFAAKITQARPDVEIKGFLTTFETTDTATNILEAMPYFHASDTILVLNQYSREIMHHLKAIGVKNRILDGIQEVFPWPSHQADPALWERAKSLGRHLKSEKSREVYRFISNLRLNAHNEPTPVQHQAFYFFMDTSYGTGNQYATAQYFEYGDITAAHTIVEGGGNLGLVSRKILEAAPQARLYSFEPMQSAIEARKIIGPAAGFLAQAAHDGRYSVIPKALWSHATTLYFDTQTDDIASARAALEGSPDDQVSAISIDEFRSQKNIGPIGFIKLDVEGAEPDVLKGAKSTIEQDRPLMAISIYHTQEQLVSIPEILMENLPNYDFEIGHHSNTPWLETVLYCLPRT